MIQSLLGKMLSRELKMLSSPKIISRIAPTPSGYLHLGNAYNFAYTYLLTKSQSGILHLRIDDIDATRSRPEYIEDIFRVLDWLKVEWEHGPSSPDNFKANYSQINKIEEYRAEVEKIKELTYPCRCSRKSIKEQYLDGVYRGACKNAAIDYVDEVTSIRLEVPESEECFQAMGHPILWRKDNLPSYQLVSVYEDEQKGINTIVRGKDLEESTSIQMYLAKLLNYQLFPQSKIIHHELLLDNEGNKLSKSEGALSMREIITGGKSYDSFLKGLSHYFEIPLGASLDEMAQKMRETT